MVQQLIAWSYKSEAEEAAPVRSPEELKALVDKIKRALRLSPESADLHFKLSEVYMEMKRFGEAVQSFKETLRFDPDHPKASFQLGRACLEAGRDEEALELFKQALIREPESETVKGLLARTHISLSKTYGRMCRLDDAMEHIKGALEIIPDYGPACLSRGILYFDIGKYKEAIEDMKEALRLDKNLNIDAHYNMGKVYSKLDKEKDAIKHYKQAIKVEPRAALPNLNLGLLYMKKKKYNDAADCLQTAIKYSPRLVADAHYKLGWVLMKLDRSGGAVEPLREAVKLSPDNDRVCDLFAEALYKTTPALRKSEKYEEELEALVEAVRANPTHCGIHYQLGEAYDRAEEGYQSIKHTMIAKQYFVEDHKDGKIAETLKSIQQRFRKYGYRQEDFAKLRIPRR